ncbi:DUF6781 family protein [Nitrosomonas sp. Nm132]|jgi:hypothetical protein|uniref:DUF6781 family protein n=1 Tax=Nitrosomonas sp. Nm132 TaxID=1881053 RepID=UPI0008805612|nr:DUF6781 family protein [Nitrosomonas sp. Nm132]SDG90752.1 hypothetical protein SAMN05428952_100248 [Nitrosomonas sp. Nm132]
MKNESNRTTHNQEDMAKLESDVREAIAHGGDVKETVRQLTLKAMQANRLDIESLGRIATAVMQGVHDGAQQKLEHATEQSHAAQTQITHAVSGLDTALAQFAEASKLAVEEAAGKAQQFSRDELTKTRADLETLESLFLDIVQHTSTVAKGVIAETLNDLLAHAKRNGTTIGAQLKETLATFTHQIASVGHAQFEAGLQLTQATADLLHKITSGVLTGVSEQTKHDKNK